MPIRRPLRVDAEYNQYVKDFYRTIEDYDWNTVTDTGQGLESILHKRREKKIKQLIKQYGQKPGAPFLDIGCGTGLILRHLPAGSVGIDLNPRHLARAQKYVPQAQLKLGDAEKLDFPDQSFSTIVCTEVLEHLVHPEIALKEMDRVLQPGGIVIGSTPRHALLWRLRWLSSTHYHNEPFHNEFARTELEVLFKDWQIVSLNTGCFGAIFFFVLHKV